MERYSDIDRDSGVVMYEIHTDKIIVKFSDGKAYSYSHSKAGQHHVERMKILARSGEGLNAYINKHVRKRYD